MSKRAYASAFLDSTPAGMLVTAVGFDAPQPQLQPPSHIFATTSPCAPIPGAWPSDDTFLASDEQQHAPRASFFTTLGRWATNALNPALLSNLPHRLLQRFWRKQEIKAVPVITSSGSNKKRFIDAGLADEPATPSPSVRARAKIAHRQRDTSATYQTLDVWSSTTSPETPPSFTSPLALAQVCDELHTPSTPENLEYDDYDIDMSFDEAISGTPLLPTSYNAIAGESSAQYAAPPVTPMRRHLLKLQLRTHTKNLEQGSPDSDILPIPSTNYTDEENDALPESSSPFESDIEGLPISSSPFQTDVDSPVPAPEYENDLSFLSDAPPLPVKKRVRWSACAGAKPFYFDEKVSEMLDSTLEAINFSPVKPTEDYFDDAEDEAETEDGEANDFATPQDENGYDSDAETASDDGGFHGVPADTFDDSEDSLEESRLSEEFIQDLQDDLQRKLALAPPPPPPVKALVSPLTSDELKSLEAAAASTHYGKDRDALVVAEKELKAKDFGTLLPHQFDGDRRAWLNDEIVNEYLAILIASKKKEAGFEHRKGGPAPQVHAFSSFWYTNVSRTVASVRRWAARFQLQGDQYLEADLLLYPICDRGHWRLLAVKPKERSIEYFDSLGFDGDQYVKKLKEYLKAELKDSYKEDDWSVVQLQRSSRQINGSDCGVFTLLNALALLRGEEATRVVACDGMADARERIAITIMAGHPTTELD
ncbi:hypothetical protein ACN47E_009145 [Coniothyrium glycines]